MKKGFFVLAFFLIPSLASYAVTLRSLGPNNPSNLEIPSAAITGLASGMFAVPSNNLQIGDEYFQTDKLLTFQWNGQTWQELLVSVVYSPTITPTITNTPTPTPTFTPVNTPAGTSPTWTPTKTNTPTFTPTPTGSPTPVFTNTPTMTPTPQFFLFTNSVVPGAPYTAGASLGFTGNVTISGGVTLHVNGGILSGIN